MIFAGPYSQLFDLSTTDPGLDGFVALPAPVPALGAAGRVVAAALLLAAGIAPLRRRQRAASRPC